MTSDLAHYKLTPKHYTQSHAMSRGFLTGFALGRGAGGRPLFRSTVSEEADGRKRVSELGIELTTPKTDEACKAYDETASQRKTIAAFQLTC